jgi:intracellular multiplication protein IcmP
MPAPQGGGQGGGDNSTGILWGIAAIFATLGAVWYFFKTKLVVFYLTLKLYELTVLSAIGSLLNHPYYFEPLKQAIISARINAQSLTFENLLIIGANVGVWWRMPLIVLLLVLAVVVYVCNTTRVFRRTYNMKDFAKLESKNWPQITPVLNLDLINTDIDAGPWAMAMTPMQFCKKNHLLEEVRVQRPDAASRKDRDRLEVVLKRGDANKIFAMQLGPLFAGPQKLPPYLRALFAVFAG